MKNKSVTVKGNIDQFEVVKGKASKEVIKILWSAWAFGRGSGLAPSATNAIQATNHRSGDLSLKAPIRVWDVAEKLSSN